MGHGQHLNLKWMWMDGWISHMHRIIHEKHHYGDVIMGPITTQVTSPTVLYSTVYQTQIKENIKAPRHWPLCGEFTGDR